MKSRGHRLDYKLCQLVSLIYGRGIRVLLGVLQLGRQRQFGLVWDFSPLVPTFLTSRFLTSASPLLFPCAKQPVGYAVRVWDLRSLQFMLNGLCISVPVPFLSYPRVVFVYFCSLSELHFCCCFLVAELRCSHCNSYFLSKQRIYVSSLQERLKVVYCALYINGK